MSKLLFPAIVIVLIVTLGFVYKNYETTQKTQINTPQKVVDVHASDEFMNLEASIISLKDRVRRFPNDLKAKVQLAMALTQQSRISGEHSTNDLAALDLLKAVLDKEPTNFDALCVQSTVLLSQHHFTEGLEVAKKLVAAYPDAAFGYGSLCDAHVELGNYTAAVEAADKMVSMRPDLRSYSRVSYLREIHGDTEGAKQAMELAVKSGVAGLERTEWCRVQLAKLHETTNNLKKAEELYQMSLAARTDYPFALAGLARLAMIRKDYIAAEDFFQKANAGLSEPQFNDELADVYLVQNQRIKAENILREQIKILGGDHDDNDPNHRHNDAALPQHGHYADKEVAEAYIKLGDYRHAQDFAQIEYMRRPDNIETSALMAWTLYKNGSFAAALPLAEKALRTNTQNPELLYKMSQILEKNQQQKRGSELLKKALAVNPNLNTSIL
jgi:tetratricopeptide (TPR) repeat protein